LADSSSLSPAVESLDRSSGKVVVNGGDTRRPTVPFTFQWGDGQTTHAFFPAAHTYADTGRNYAVMVTAHYADGSTDSRQLDVFFVTAATQPIVLPEGVRVTVPSSPVALASRMPGYSPPARLTAFDDARLDAATRAAVEYVLTAAASVQKDFANNDVYEVDGAFRQVVLLDPEFGGMYSLWFTSPVSFGASATSFSGTPQYSSFFHEMGHNVTLNSPASYYYGGKIDGSANAIFSEAMAQIFQHATAYELINNRQQYGLSDDVVSGIKESGLSSMRIVVSSYQAYVSGGKRFASWNDPSTPQDETFGTFMTIAYKFCEHAEKGASGYRMPLKRTMALLQTFDEDTRSRYDQSHNTEAAATFRATLMAAALSYGFETDLRSELRDLGFPINDTVYDELHRKAAARPLT